MHKMMIYVQVIIERLIIQNKNIAKLQFQNMLSQEQQQKLLSALLKKPQNALCADCNSKSPCWASLDFGVFVCMNCSGAHRSLGQSVTRIKSTKLDTWNRDWLWHMQLNNKLINQYFQATLNPVLHKKPNPSSSLNEIKKFVHDKYVRRLFSKAGQDDPITNLKSGKAPLSQPNTPTQISQKAKSTTSQAISVPVNTVKLTPANKKVDSLLDDASDDTNRTPSVGNQKVREDVNLFQDFEQISGIKKLQTKENVGRQHSHQTYDKGKYNSFSGTGAGHSTTGGINFDDIFATTSSNPSKQTGITFQQLKPTQPTINPPQIYQTSIPYQTPNQYPSGGQSHHPMAHIHHHNLPHMHIYTTGTGTGTLGHSNTGQQYHHHIPSQPTHVTMNINMNMYGNVTNINLRDGGDLGTTNGKGINQCIKLDLKDFDTGKKVQQTKGKSWVDDWK